MKALLVALLLSSEPAPPEPGVHPVTLKVGEKWSVCSRGIMACPALLAMCDDEKVAKPTVDEKVGLQWVAVSPGTTTCSAAAAPALPRAVFKITVR